MQVGCLYVEVLCLIALQNKDRGEVGKKPYYRHDEHNKPSYRLWVYKTTVRLHKKVETDTNEQNRIEKCGQNLEPSETKCFVCGGLPLRDEVRYVGNKNGGRVRQIVERIRKQRETVGDNSTNNLYESENYIEKRRCKKPLPCHIRIRMAVRMPVMVSMPVATIGV